MWLGGPCRIPPRRNLHQPFHEIGQDPAIATRASRSNNPGSLDSHVPMLSPPLAPDRDSSSTSRHPLPRGILHRLRNHDSRGVARKGCQPGRSVRPSWVATCLDPGGRWGARDPPCTGVLSAPGTPQSDRPRPRHLGPPGDGMDGAYAPHNRHNDQPLGTIETKVVAVQWKRSRQEGRQDKASRERL